MIRWKPYQSSNNKPHLVSQEIYFEKPLAIFFTFCYIIDTKRYKRKLIMTTATSTAQDYSVPDGLIPAEAAARLKRSMGFPQPRFFGGTVDQEGLANNYAVSPKRSVAEMTPTKTRLWQAVAFAAVTWTSIAVAILVS